MEERQRNKLGFILNSVYVLLILALVYVFVRYLFGLISPFLLAFGIAYLLENPSRRLAARLKVPMKAVSLLLVLVLYGITGLAMFLAGAKIISVVTTAALQLPGLYRNNLVPFLTAMLESAEQLLARLDPALMAFLSDGFQQFINSLGDIISDVSRALVGHISNFAGLLPSVLLKTLLMVISTFFFAGDCDRLSHTALRQLTPRGREIVGQVLQYLRNTLLVVARSYLIIMVMTFVQLAIGFGIIGIPNAMLIAFSIAVFDILPVLGTGGIMIPWMIVVFFQRNYPLAIGLLVVYAVVTVVRNVVEPKIVGKQLDLHPAVTLMSMFVGVSLFGLVGLFGFPIGISLLRHLDSVGTIKLFAK
jgi:sporulation integral membrane protein YtvI